jgi:hypothetical protein
LLKTGGFERVLRFEGGFEVLLLLSAASKTGQAAAKSACGPQYPFLTHMRVFRVDDWVYELILEVISKA